MNRDDALLYLPFEDEDDIEDLYEEKLFAFKQKIMGSVPSTKLYQHHLNRFSKVYNAFVYLTSNVNTKRLLKYTVKVNQDSLLLAWRDFNRNKNELKLLLSGASRFDDIEFILNCLIENQKQFALIFQEIEFHSHDENIVVGKEPDAMALEVEIDKFINSNQGGIESITKLDVTNLLYLEANRLSLWLKTENNVR